MRISSKGVERPDDLRIELTAADHEEPTWELRQPAGKSRRRIDGRTRSILVVAAVAAVVVNAGAAWAYWQITGSATRQAASGAAVELALRAKSDLNKPMRPGQTGNLTVTIINDQAFPIRITSVTPGPGRVVADAARRDAGCVEPAVTLTKQRFDVAWEVPRNTIGVFTISRALRMRPDAPAACAGGSFTVPVRTAGTSRDAG